jgi:hypothetical protein
MHGQPRFGLYNNLGPKIVAIQIDSPKTAQIRDLGRSLIATLFR